MTVKTPKERPILFSAPMVRAILDGRKTQTRRVVKTKLYGREMVNLALAEAENCDDYSPGDLFFTGRFNDPHSWGWQNFIEYDPLTLAMAGCPYGQRGDRLWVRETWQSIRMHDRLSPRDIPVGADIQYPATYDGWDSKRRSPIHMPRWASRITLEITEIRVERLQDISRGDAMAEGCPFANMADGPNPRHWYADLWEQINGEGSWDANPWVWVIGFEPVERHNVTP